LERRHAERELRCDRIESRGLHRRAPRRRGGRGADPALPRVAAGGLARVLRGDGRRRRRAEGDRWNCWRGPRAGRGLLHHGVSGDLDGADFGGMVTMDDKFPPDVPPRRT